MGFVPKTVRDDVFIWHNHVMHTTDTGHGDRGFRCHFEFRPVNYRKFMHCECGWSGLPHYSIRVFGKQKSVTPAKLQAALGT